jgi:hypothetical protein
MGRSVRKINVAALLTLLLVSISIFEPGFQHTSATRFNVTALNLPPTPVTIEVGNGTGSYFDTLVGGVPSGYDVTNATYTGWCVDKRYDMTRAPAIHEVTLYSTLNPPLAVAAQKWDMVNYILNNKRGTANDVQQAIWYFINMVGKYSPTSTLAWSMVNDTVVNGTGFVPGDGQVIGVICYPLVLPPDAKDVQISIIEIKNPQTPEIEATLFFDPDVINLASSCGYLMAFIELPEGYNLSDINVSTIMLNSTIPAEPSPTIIGDHNNNTIQDMMIVFNRTLASSYIILQGISVGNITLLVTGKLAHGTAFKGLAVVRVSGLMGDVDCDGDVDLDDLVLLAASYYAAPGDSNYNPNANFVPPCEINLPDLVTIGVYYEKY